MESSGIATPAGVGTTERAITPPIFWPRRLARVLHALQNAPQDLGAQKRLLAHAEHIAAHQDEILKVSMEQLTTLIGGICTEADHLRGAASSEAAPLLACAQQRNKEIDAHLLKIKDLDRPVMGTISHIRGCAKLILQLKQQREGQPGAVAANIDQEVQQLVTHLYSLQTSVARLAENHLLTVQEASSGSADQQVALENKSLRLIEMCKRADFRSELPAGAVIGDIDQWTHMLIETLARHREQLLSLHEPPEVVGQTKRIRETVATLRTLYAIPDRQGSYDVELTAEALTYPFRNLVALTLESAQSINKAAEAYLGAMGDSTRPIWMTRAVVKGCAALLEPLKFLGKQEVEADLKERIGRAFQAAQENIVGLQQLTLRLAREHLEGGERGVHTRQRLIEDCRKLQEPYDLRTWDLRGIDAIDAAGKELKAMEERLRALPESPQEESGCSSSSAAASSVG